MLHDDVCKAAFALTQGNGGFNARLIYTYLQSQGKCWTYAQVRSACYAIAKRKHAPFYRRFPAFYVYTNTK